MTDPETTPQRVRMRNLLEMFTTHDDTMIGVEHVYLAEGTAGTCEHDGCDNPAYDPGMILLTIDEDGGLLSAQEALLLANRLTRAASLVLESDEEPPDVEREAARYSRPASETDMPARTNVKSPRAAANSHGWNQGDAGIPFSPKPDYSADELEGYIKGYRAGQSHRQRK